MLDLSVIVPTHNRVGYLPGLLASLAAQDYPPARWELIVVSDGSEDGTQPFLDSGEGARPANLHVIHQKNSGVAKARNNGAAEAQGRAVLFLDDDMIASPSLVGEHARAHLQTPRSVVIGHVTLPSEGREAWVAWEDAQMLEHFDALKSGSRVPGPRDFYSGNCSVSTGLFEAVSGYDTTLPRAEDVEIGYRLEAAGASFHYLPKADSLHLGRHAFGGWLRNARLYGECDVVLGWQKGHTVLQRDLFRWFAGRSVLTRALVRACSALPPLEPVAIALLDAAGRAAYREGGRRVSAACYSAIYNLAYWLSVERALGPAMFRLGVRAAGGRPLPPGQQEQSSRAAAIAEEG